MTLSQEVRIQAREFRELREACSGLDELTSTVRERIDLDSESLEEARSIARKALDRREREDDETRGRLKREARRDLLEVLADTRDHLERGILTARDVLAQDLSRPIPGWVRWTGLAARIEESRRALSALADGYRLGLERLREALSRVGLHEIPGLGQPFDPGCMNAVQIEARAGVPDGTVVEVHRRGYFLEGSLFRTAQVTVARGGSSTPPAGDSPG